MTYQFLVGRKYVKAYETDGAGGRQAVAFLDLESKLWLEAASWTKPGRRISMVSDDLARQWAEQ